MVALGIKEPFEERGGFIQPFDSKELDSLYIAELGLVNYNTIKKGRGKRRAFLGDKAAAVIASIPSEVRGGFTKTDLLNFVGDIMELAGYLDNEVVWKECTKELERYKELNLSRGAITKQRKKIVENWLKGAKDAYRKADITPKCKDCKCYNDCHVSRVLQFYDI